MFAKSNCLLPSPENILTSQMRRARTALAYIYLHICSVGDFNVWAIDAAKHRAVSTRMVEKHACQGSDTMESPHTGRERSVRCCPHLMRSTAERTVVAQGKAARRLCLDFLAAEGGTGCLLYRDLFAWCSAYKKQLSHSVVHFQF